ncbi:MAG: thiolase family protein [SAR202 cluster bacterium]|jgi:acetyl-CoA C-acetyltransferase|nr:thiolase family protein [SAR202 cluster bacterium]
MRDAVIVSGARTPIGSFGGVFKDVPASDLGAAAIRSALERADLEPEQIDEVFMGNVLQAEEAGYAARLSALRAGIPDEVPAITVNRACSSGLEAINIAASFIRSGEIEVAVAGGTENMSRSPFLLGYQSRFDGLRMGNTEIRDSLIEGLSCPVNDYHMGVGAENIAEKYEISREDQDALALLSHQRAVSAMQDGRFTNQIVNIPVSPRRGDRMIVQTDEGPRSDTTMESLSKLKAVFKEGGTVTPGNASNISDGAAAVVIMSEEKAGELGITSCLRWRSRGVAGVDPAYYGVGPVPAVRKALKKGGIGLEDIDLIELNEAFAAQVLHNIRGLQIDLAKTNVNGSGISLGHPIGATGAIMTVRLMEELQRRNQTMGLVTMCVGGGMGVATIFERIVNSN